MLLHCNKSNNILRVGKSSNTSELFCIPVFTNLLNVYLYNPGLKAFQIPM